MRERKDDKDEGALEEVWSESGWGGETEHDEEWCGMFAASNLYRGARLDEELRSGLYNNKNVSDFFTYGDKANARRSPGGIFADGRWWRTREYHTARGAERRWMTRDELTNGARDIRPGDMVLVSTDAGKGQRHIVMVESYDAATDELVTIEGNIRGGIQPDKNGEVARDADGAIEPGKKGAPHSGVNVRELSSNDKKAHAKSQKSKAYKSKGGWTVKGVGRHSLVDFEEHDYAAKAVPAILRDKSPAEIEALSKSKDKSQEKERKAAKKQVKRKGQKGNLIKSK